jgi:hypothetical protein
MIMNYSWPSRNVGQQPTDRRGRFLVIEGSLVMWDSVSLDYNRFHPRPFQLISR